MFLAFIAAVAAPLPPPMAPFEASPAKAIAPGSWFSPDDYPVDARKAGKEGTVRFEVNVDASGKPTACRIVSTSGSTSLDEATCRSVIAKGQFTPATLQGKPVASTYTSNTTWKLEGPVPASVAASSRSVSIVSMTIPGKPTPIDELSWFKVNDYPADAQKAGKEGVVIFEVTVGADGKPSACRIARSSGTPSLDETTCRVVMERAHFKPAMVNGKAVTGVYTKPTSWRLQGGVPTNGYFAAIVDYKDVDHPQCSIIQEGAIGPPVCDQVLSHYETWGTDRGLKKLVELVSVTLGDAEPYRGEADWGRRISFTSVDLYLTKGGKRSCVVVAATGAMADPAPCASFHATAVLTDEEKKATARQHLERSVFAVVRQDAASGTCKANDAERAGCS